MTCLVVTTACAPHWLPRTNPETQHIHQCSKIKEKSSRCLCRPRVMLVSLAVGQFYEDRLQKATHNRSCFFRYDEILHHNRRADLHTACRKPELRFPVGEVGDTRKWENTVIGRDPAGQRASCIQPTIHPPNLVIRASLLLIYSALEECCSRLPWICLIFGFSD